MFLHRDLLVSSVAVGNNFCVLATIDGKVYSWGANGYGQLGQGGYSVLVDKP